MNRKTGARVAIGLPYYQDVVGHVIASHRVPCDSKGQNVALWHTVGDSFLCRGFNKLWCMALNGRGKFSLTHFCMIHADVLPYTPYWLDVMLKEMKENGGDLLSVVLPIKTAHGLTSTALMERTTGNIRRLTMHEVVKLPQTFDGAAVAGALGWDHPYWDLLPSTGLWVCDMTSCWVEKVWFEVRDRILRKDNGEFYQETLPDDWGFACKLHTLGLRLLSTRAVVAGHWGPAEFRNDMAWGMLQEDNAVGSFSWLDEDVQGGVPSQYSTSSRFSSKT